MSQRIEARVQTFVQNWIADPLQWSGIPLGWQIRCALLLMAIAVIGWFYWDAARHDWFDIGLDCIVIPFALFFAIYGMSGPQKMIIAKESKWLGLGACVCMIVSFDWVRLFALGMALRHYLVRCEPKPPVGNLDTAPEGL